VHQSRFAERVLHPEGTGATAEFLAILIPRPVAKLFRQT